MSNVMNRRSSPNDDLYTPPEALAPIVKWLHSKVFFHGPKLVWEPCSGAIQPIYMSTIAEHLDEDLASRGE